MNKTFIFKGNYCLVSGLLFAGLLQFASSCKTTDEPTAIKKDSLIADQMYTGIENASMTYQLARARYAMQSSSLTNQAIFAGGYEGSQSLPLVNDIDRFDSETSTISVTSFPGANDAYRIGSSPITTIGSKLYYKGYFGANGSYKPQSLKVYDMISGVTSFIKLGTPRLVEVVSVSGDKVILLSGVDSPNVPPMESMFAVDIYDTKTQSSSTLRLPGNFSANRAVTLNDKVFITGFTYTNEQAVRSNTIQVLDLKTNTFSSLNLDGSNGNSPAEVIAATDGKILLQSTDAYLHVFDVTANSWSKSLFPFGSPEFISGLSITTANNLAIFAGGSKINDNTYLDDIDVYNTRTKTWSKERMSEKKSGVGLAPSGRFIVIAGGKLSQSQSSRKVEYFLFKK